MSTESRCVKDIARKSDRDQAIVRVLHLYKDNPKFSDGSVRLSARLESSDGLLRNLWFELPEELFSMTTESLDPYLIASIFHAMKEKSHLHVHGAVSKVLLRNLDEFQAVWQSWLPDQYSSMEITADIVQTTLAPSTESAVAAFSGGVDSTYTIWRHNLSNRASNHGSIEAGLFVHGFDIPLEQSQQFINAARQAQSTLKSAGVELIPMRCNLYDPDWEMTHGSALAACLNLLKGRFGKGMIAGTYTYKSLNLPWGSNPISDRLLSSGGFDIIHDSAAVRREEKILSISSWFEGFNNLRICYEGPERDKNCCRCAKCLMMFISLKVLHLPNPISFADDMDGEELLALTDLRESFAEVFVRMVSSYQKAGFENERWFAYLRRCAAYNKRRIELSRPLSNPVADFARKMLLRLHDMLGP